MNSPETSSTTTTATNARGQSLIGERVLDVGVGQPPPVVLHYVRTYLDPSEVFIHTQICAIRRHTARVVARERASWSERLFPFADVNAYAQTRPGGDPRVASLGYRLLGRMSRRESAWYRAEIAAAAPAVLHVHFAVDAAYLAPVIRSMSVPAVVSCYGYDVSGFPRRYGGLGKAYLQRAFRAADLFLAMSDDMRTDLLDLGCPQEKVEVHYYGIDLSRFPVADRTARCRTDVRVLFAGALVDKKGVTRILQAFLALAPSYPGLDLRFVGEGPLETTLRSRVAQAGLDERVTFAGYVPNERLAEELAAADIFCHPSEVDRDGNKEGIPGTIVEAAATGLPVVATRHAGIPTAVIDGRTGILVNERDTTGLTEAIRRLVDTPDERLSMGLAGSAHVRTIGDARTQTLRLERIYDDLARRRVAAKNTAAKG